MIQSATALPASTARRAPTTDRRPGANRRRPLPSHHPPRRASAARSDRRSAQTAPAAGPRSAPRPRTARQCAEAWPPPSCGPGRGFPRTARGARPSAAPALHHRLAGAPPAAALSPPRTGGGRSAQPARSAERRAVGGRPGGGWRRSCGVRRVGGVASGRVAGGLRGSCWRRPGVSVGRRSCGGLRPASAGRAAMGGRQVTAQPSDGFRLPCRSAGLAARSEILGVNCRFLNQAPPRSWSGSHRVLGGSCRGGAGQRPCEVGMHKRQRERAGGVGGRVSAGILEEVWPRRAWRSGSCDRCGRSGGELSVDGGCLEVLRDEFEAHLRRAHPVDVVEPYASQLQCPSPAAAAFL